LVVVELEEEVVLGQKEFVQWKQREEEGEDDHRHI